MKWVKLREYCRQSGDTRDAVHQKLRAGTWLKGTHAKVAGDGNLWVNLQAVEQWVESSNPSEKTGQINEQGNRSPAR